MMCRLASRPGSPHGDALLPCCKAARASLQAISPVPLGLLSPVDVAAVSLIWGSLSSAAGTTECERVKCESVGAGT